MIEPLSLFTAIAGVTNIATRLTVDLTRLTVTLKHVPDQITQVCNEMVSLNATLSTLQQRFNPSASGYTEEQLHCLETVISATRETLVQLARLSDACETTGKRKPGVTGIWKKMSWTLNESEIASYRSGLVGYTAMLNCLTATLADQRGQNIEAMVTKTNEMLQSLVEKRGPLPLTPGEYVDDMASLKSTQKPKVPPKVPTKSRKRSSSVASQIGLHIPEPRGRKEKESSKHRSRSVAPAMSRGGSSNGIPSDIRHLRDSNPYGSGKSNSNWKARSASTSHLPLPTSTPPPLPGATNYLAVPSHGLASPPPEYTEVAPGLFEETSSLDSRSHRQVIRTSRSPGPISSRAPSSRPPSSRSSSSRPSFRRAFSASSSKRESSPPKQNSKTPPVPPTPALPAKGKIDGHKLEFAGKWSVKQIRINDSFMGSGVLFLRKDEPSKRVLVNLRLDSSKDTRLSYRWIDSSSATRTKASSMFAGPSYILQNLVRADDYSGAPSGKTSVRLEDIDYLAGQRSLMIAINLIQQSPAEWLVDTKPRDPPVVQPTGIHAPAPVSPPAGSVRNFFRAMRAPSESNYSEAYSPSEGTYNGAGMNNYSRPSPSQQYPVWARVTAPPTPPDSPLEGLIDSRSRCPSVNSSIGTACTADSRFARSSYENGPTPRHQPAHESRGRTGHPGARCEFPNEAAAAAQKRGRPRAKRGPSSWFTFGRA